MIPCAATIDARPASLEEPQHQPHNPLTHYVVVRSDLPVGLQAANLVHAAGESSPGGLPSGTYAVALHATHAQLAHLAMRLRASGVPHACVHEPDAPWCGALMAIGLVPAPREEVRRLVSSLPLVK